MKKRYVIISALMILALIFAGCGSSGTSSNSNSSSSSVIEPQQLISKAEAQTLTGLKLKDGEKTEQAVVGQKIIFYDSDSTSTGVSFLQVSLTQQAFMPSGSSNTPQSIYNSIKSAFPDAVKVDGIGDEAFIATPGLHIYADGYYIVIAAGNSDKASVQKVIKEAGMLAVQHLEELIK